MGGILKIGGYKISVKRALIMLAFVAIGILVIHSYASLPAHTTATSECTRDDSDCIREMNNKKEECIPSSTIITGRDGIILMVNITREGDKCVRTEAVIGYEELKSGYLLGHNVTCVSDLSELEDPRSQACPGSLYDYVVPSGGSGDPGGSAPPGPPPIPQITCAIDDDECKALADSYLQNCINSRTTNTEFRWEPDGYWTLFFNVSRQPVECNYYVEVLNAVNLPPGTPITVIGSNMTCDIPLSAFPVGMLNSTWCEGSLYSYLYP